jgi:hypothetical protein
MRTIPLLTWFLLERESYFTSIFYGLHTNMKTVLFISSVRTITAWLTYSEYIVGRAVAEVESLFY